MPIRKKIFDIGPRQVKSKEPSADAPEKEFTPLREVGFKPQEKDRIVFSPVKKIVILFLVLFAGGALSYFLIPHKVKVEIWPEQKRIAENLTALINASRGGNDIAGQIIEEEKTVSRNFAATGKKMKSVKAQGIIRIYNNYSTASQPLLALTRFVSDDGKLFRTPVRVVIPGGHYEGGKLVSGFVDIEVVADQPGEDYNIDASTFSIPGFAGTPKYTAFYAKSAEPMKGGLLKEVSQVSQSDLDKAKEVLTQQAISEATAALKDSLSSGGSIVFDEAVTSKLNDFKSEAEAGKEAENFTAQAMAKVSALVFKESDLKNFAIDYIKSKIPAEEKLVDSFLKIEYLLTSVNQAKSEFSLKLSISARSYLGYEDNKIKEMVRNKSPEDVEAIIKSIPGIERARINFWPFWIKLAPDDLKSIEVVWHLD